MPDNLKTKLKYFLSIILIASMFSQSLKFSYLVYYYASNNAEFTAEYCENIDKPALKCNGKCHLKKELAKTATDTKPVNSDQKQNTSYQTELLFFDTSTKVQYILNYRYLIKRINATYLNLYSDLFTNSAFHPPQNLLFI